MSTWDEIVKEAYEFLSYDNIQEPNEEDIKFMKEAYKEASKATNCSVQVGSVLVKDGQVLGGSQPMSIPGVPMDKIPPFDASKPRYMAKYDYIWFSEMKTIQNAIQNGHDINGSVLYKYCGCPPESFKYMLMFGVRKFVFSVQKNEGLYSDNMVSNAIMAKLSGAEIKLVRDLTKEEVGDSPHPKNLQF